MKYEKAKAQVIKFKGTGLFMDGSGNISGCTTWSTVQSTVQSAFVGCNSISGPDYSTGRVCCNNFECLDEDGEYSSIVTVNSAVFVFYNNPGGDEYWECQWYTNLLQS